jgi:hypothetical protein
MAFEPRKTLFVDQRVQGALLTRAVGYCLLTTLFVAAGYVVWNVGRNWSRPLGEVLLECAASFAPALLALLLALPVVMFDCLRVTNRFVGPLYRMRRYLRRIARGEPVEPIMFRSRDFWHEIAEEFNTAVAQLERERLVAADGTTTVRKPALYPIEVG